MVRTAPQLRDQRGSIRNESCSIACCSSGYAHEGKSPYHHPQFRHKHFGGTAIWLLFVFGLCCSTAFGFDTDRTQARVASQPIDEGDSPGVVVSRNSGRPAARSHAHDGSADYVEEDGMSMLSLVVAVVSLLGGIGWPEGANPSEKVGRRRLRRSKGKKDKCAKRGRRLPKDLFGKVSVLLIGLVCSWVLRAGLGGERPTGVLSADKSGYQGMFMERHRAVEDRGRDSGDPRWALMRDMGVTKGGRQSMVEVEGRAWIKRRLVPRHGAQATWRAASADRPLAKAQGHRGGPTLGRYLINEAADFAARLVLAMRAVAIKRGGMSGGIGCHVAGWSKAAFHGLLRHEAGDHQEVWKRAACVRTIFAARWAAGGRRPWPRRGQGLPRGHYDCILVIVVTKCLWVDDGDGLGYYVGEECPHSPPAGPKAVPDGPIVTRLFDSGGCLGCLAHPGCGQEQSYIDVADDHGTVSTICRCRCDDRHGYNNNAAWTGPGQFFPLPPRSFLSPLLVDRNQLDIGRQSFDRREEGCRDGGSEMALRNTRMHRRNRMQTGPAVAEGGDDDPATHGSLGDDSGGGGGSLFGGGDDDVIWGRDGDGWSGDDEGCDEVGSTIVNVIVVPGLSTPQVEDGSDDGRSSNGSGHQRSPPPSLPGLGRAAQYSHTGGRARVQDGTRKARRHAGAPRRVASIGNSSTTTMKLHAEDVDEGRFSGLCQSKGVVADTQRPLQLQPPPNNIDVRRASNGGWDVEQWGARRQQADGGGSLDSVPNDATVCTRRDRRAFVCHPEEVSHVSDLSSDLDDNSTFKQGYPEVRRSVVIKGDAHEWFWFESSDAVFGEPQSTAFGAEAAEQHRDQQHLNVAVHLAEGVHLLDLRGGGGVTGEGVPPGAGVARWLVDDVDLEEAERRWADEHGSRSTAMPPQDDTGFEDRANRMLGPRVIFGIRNGREIVVCPTCAEDIPKEDWSSHSCNTRGQVRQLIDFWEDEARSRCHEAAMANSWLGTAWPCGDVYADVANPGDLGNDQGCPWQEQAAVRRCGNCGLSMATVGTSWRICKCMAVYCEACAGGPCHSCGAQSVWQMPAGRSQVDDHSERGSCDQCDHEFADFCHDGEDEDRCRKGDHGTQMTPAEIAVRRARQIEEKLQQQREKKAEWRRMRDKQIREGRRPRRDKSRNDEVAFISANVTSPESLKEELTFGKDLWQCDYLLLQEHGLRDEAKARAVKWAEIRGWDPFIQKAYIKETAAGGGTAILGKGAYGIRPGEEPPDEFEGRLTIGTGNIDGEVSIASVYGFTGGSAKAQVPLIAELVRRLKIRGRPVVAGGDWQITPEQMRDLGIEKTLGVTICAPRVATNVRSKRVIDYFLVSNELVKNGWRVQALHGTRLATHLPVRLILKARRLREDTVRLAQPRPLPIGRAIGPARATIGVNWVGWRAANSKDNNGDDDDRVDNIKDESVMDGKGGIGYFNSNIDIGNIDNTELEGIVGVDESMDRWFAGAEMELLEAFDLDAPGTCEPYLGIGRPVRTVEGSQDGKYRDVPDELGLAGHRATWTSRGLHEFRRLRTTGESEQRWSRGQDIMRRISCRAEALARAWPKERARILEGRVRLGVHEEVKQRNLQELCDVIQEGLNFLGMLGITRRGTNGTSWIARARLREADDMMQAAEKIQQKVEALSDKVAADRMRLKLKETRKWAREASLRVAHRATKTMEEVTRKSASSDKGHRGERTPQEAAEAGRKEWGKVWKATSSDQSEDILRTIEALFEVGRLENEHDTILLPPLTPQRLKAAAKKFRGDTALGVDRIRPRHLLELSDAALEALCDLFAAIEKQRRWPELIRSVIEVALGKKKGGSRLVGIGAGLYRTWARVRYGDCQATIEKRIDRPFMAAAPGRGAALAAFDLGWQAEEAWAYREKTITTCVDFQAFYEHITLSEVAVGCRRYGLPVEIVTLAAHMYTGPRRIRVQQAVSRPTYPTQSIIAGCTWATLLVRVIIIPPAEELLKIIGDRARSWGIKVDLMIYIDDGAITSIGDTAHLAHFHGWMTRMLLLWISQTLKKSVAKHKVVCIAGDREIRKAVKVELGGTHIRVQATGELLGVDYAAGGRLGHRPLQAQRRCKALRRRSRLRWWMRMGGKGEPIAAGGMLPELSYGCDAVGLPPAAMRDARKIIASANAVSAAGSSLTAKLAIGGPQGNDAEPILRQGNIVVQAVLNRLWDRPQCRHRFVRTWSRARADLDDEHEGTNWASSRGPVGVAMLQLRRLGVKWAKPFVLGVGDHELKILEMPPLQTLEIIRHQGRIFMDKKLLERLCAQWNWPLAQVLQRYQHGIDWDLLRTAIWKSPRATSAETHALKVIVSGAFWTEERRWMAGMRGHGSCVVCSWESGSTLHALEDCNQVQDIVSAAKREGRLQGREIDLTDDGLQPLRFHALPPRVVTWEPVDYDFREGGLSMGDSGWTFGDGSGFRQQQRETRIAAWSVVRLKEEGVGGGRKEGLRGLLSGWFLTVPRAELTALVEHLRHCGPGAWYGGDCQFVIKGSENGVPLKFCSSANPNADLWREVRRLQMDHGDVPKVAKIQAHRSRSAAEEDGAEAVMQWRGNHEADLYAKELARSYAAHEDNLARIEKARADHLRVLERIAIVVAWNLRTKTSLYGTKLKRPRKHTPAKDNGDHLIVNMDGGGWECAVCRGQALGKVGLRILRQRPCPGHTRDQAHESHEITETRGIIWCRKCGRFTSRWARGLKNECPGVPQSEAQSNVRRRLLQGLPPTTAEYLLRAEERWERRKARANVSDSLPESEMDRNRRQPALEDAATQHCGGPRRSSQPPVTIGRYLRLVGGPLHRDAAAAVPVSGSAVETSFVHRTAGLQHHQSVHHGRPLSCPPPARAQAGHGHEGPDVPHAGRGPIVPLRDADDRIHVRADDDRAAAADDRPRHGADRGLDDGESGDGREQSCVIPRGGRGVSQIGGADSLANVPRRRLRGKQPGSGRRWTGEAVAVSVCPSSMPSHADRFPAHHHHHHHCVEEARHKGAVARALPFPSSVPRDEASFQSYHHPHHLAEEACLSEATARALPSDPCSRPGFIDRLPSHHHPRHCVDEAHFEGTAAGALPSPSNVPCAEGRLPFPHHPHHRAEEAHVSVASALGLPSASCRDHLHHCVDEARFEVAAASALPFPGSVPCVEDPFQSHHHPHHRADEARLSDASARALPSEGCRDRRRQHGPLACVPSPTDSWSQRIIAHPNAGRTSCQICHRPTALRCRGCGGTICITCARGRRQCPSFGNEAA